MQDQDIVIHSHGRRNGRETVAELSARLRAERAKLTNPIDRIAFDNQWINGLPAGLYVLMAEREARSA